MQRLSTIAMREIGAFISKMATFETGTVHCCAMSPYKTALFDKKARKTKKAIPKSNLGYCATNPPYRAKRVTVLQMLNMIITLLTRK